MIPVFSQRGTQKEVDFMGTIATLEERDRRFQRIREAMEKEGLDALLIAGKGHGWTGRGYLRYLTDFHLWGHDGVILFPLDDTPMLCLSSENVARRIAARGWITDFRGDWHVTPTIVDEVKRRGLENKRLGIAGYTFILGAGLMDVLRQGLPEAELVNADLLMNRVRAVKSPLELQQIHELWAMSKGAMERFVAYLEPGMTERQASAEPLRYIHERGARDALIMFNGNPPEDRVIEFEDILSFHMEICNESGHFNEHTVTLAFRDPTPLELRLAEAQERAYEKVKPLARPGQDLVHLFRVFQQSLEDDGWVFTYPRRVHFEFHGQGMDWLEWPTYADNDPLGNALAGETVDEPALLEAGMVFNYHPSPSPGYFSDCEEQKDVKGAISLSDHLLITEDGGVCLSGKWDMRWRIVH